MRIFDSEIEEGKHIEILERVLREIVGVYSIGGHDMEFCGHSVEWILKREGLLAETEE